MATSSTVPAERALQPDLDAIIEVLAYLETESRRLTKGLATQYGLTGPQLVVVKLLEPVGKLSLSELSWRIKARNSTVTGIIDRMEREGLVVRSRSDEDRRVVHIELTSRGKRLASEIRIEPMEILRRALAELSQRDASDLKRILTRLARRVGELVQTAPVVEDSARDARGESEGKRGK